MIARGYTSAGWIGFVTAAVLNCIWFYLAAAMTLMAPFLFFTLPASIIATVADIWIGQRLYKSQSSTEVNPAQSSVPARSYFKAFSIGALVVSVAYSLIYVGITYALTSQGHVTEYHRMYRSNQPYGRCSTYVQLEFEAAAGYVISACAPDLLAALEDAEINPTEIVVVRSYRAGAWEYEIQQVGNWSGEAEFFGISLHCYQAQGQSSMSTSDRPCGEGEVPFRQPYRFQ